jgi:hypothetical protein
LEINETVIVASSWSSIFTLPTLMMHGQTQIKFTRTLLYPNTHPELVAKAHSRFSMFTLRHKLPL